MLQGEANFSEKPYQAVHWIAQNLHVPPFFFFPLLRIMPRSCSKLKSKSLNKETLFTASRKLLLGFFLKGHQTVYIFIKDHSQAVQVSNLTARLTSKLICVRARGGSTARTRFCTDAKGIHKAGSSGEGGQPTQALNMILKSKLIMLLALLPSFCLHFMRDGCPSGFSACWSSNGWYFRINRLPGDLLPC